MTMVVALTCLTAYLMDAVLGEPKRFHPLVGFGQWASELEQRLHPGEGAGSVLQFALGCLAWCLALAIPLMLLVMVFAIMPAWLDIALALVVLYVCIAPRSLVEHAELVAEALARNDLDAARQACGMMVSRDTQSMNETELCKATIESVLENAHDAVLAPLCWFAIAGWGGAVMFRLSNTLDAMWGYRNTRFNYFGRCAARCDDVLGFITARVTVLLYSLRNGAAIKAALEQGGHWESPNAGPVMAAGAAALNISLGGNARYHGKMKQRPVLGQGPEPTAADIGRALKLVRDAYRALLLLVLIVAVVL
ncbi:MAG: adenosylcobinamide-phosphate synthase CbiB [Oleiphilaceae bacterium]|nr:adenosylcobinamide-phosphate synthase CbiB [Oleiphilaceae bacterium]